MKPPSHSWLGYGVAVVTTIMAAVIAWLSASFFASVPTTIFVVPVVLAAYLGGLGPGLLAAAARITGFASADEMRATPAAEIAHRFEMLNEAGQPFPSDQLPGCRALLGEPSPSVLLRYRPAGGGDEHWVVVKATAVYDQDG